MSILKLILLCTFSPRLYKVYVTRSHADWSASLEQIFYVANWCETIGDFVLRTTNHVHFSFYAYCALVFMALLTSGKVDDSSIKIILYVLLTWFGVLVISLLLRAIGRAFNEAYRPFVRLLYSDTGDKRRKWEALRRYDFDFSSWPVAFSTQHKERKSSPTDSWRFNPFTYNENPSLPFYKRILVQTVGYVFGKSIAVPLIFPGMYSLTYSGKFQSIRLKLLTSFSLYRRSSVITLHWTLISAREHLVVKYNGRRAKIETSDYNHIDVMFVDQRSKSIKGHTLIVCCEGGSSFYELGTMNTCVECRYSAIGWNNPGIAWSTGYPSTKQLKNAINAILQYAVICLGFDLDHIIIYGWSIGSYTAALGAMLNPGIKCLILDAPFEDILPLVQPTSPRWSPYVQEVVRKYIDFDISSIMECYSGPVQIIRRTHDDIFTTNEKFLAANRSNHLAVNIICQRNTGFKDKDLNTTLLKITGLDEKDRHALERDCEMADVKLCSKKLSEILVDYSGRHCTSLDNHFLAKLLAKHEAPARLRPTPRGQF